MEKIKELLGTEYKEGMTSEEIINTLNTKNLADLSTGKYKNADAANAELKRVQEENQKKINDLNAQINSKLTEEELLKKSENVKDEEIKKLTNEINDTKKLMNKEKAIALTSEARIKCGISNDDKEFNEFILDLSFEDSEKTIKNGNFISKIVSAAYEKGKSEAVKENFSDLGKGFKTNSNDSKEKNFGALLAQKNGIKSNVKSRFDM